MSNKIKYKVSFYLLKDSNIPKYAICVENTETNITFNFNKPIQVIHVCVSAMVHHLDKSNSLFSFDWSGY